MNSEIIQNDIYQTWSYKQGSIQKIFLFYKYVQSFGP